MPKTKTICNWKNYNKALVKRGEIIFSFDINYISEMFYKGKQHQGGIRKFSNKMYEYLLTIKVMLRLPWRATIGFAKGLIKRAYKQEVDLPNYAHAARETNKLNLKIKSFSKKQMKKGLEIAFDSTGVNIYTTSGYHQRKYNKGNLHRKRDQWKKIHFAMDLDNQQILAMAYTKSNVNDCEVVPELSKNIRGRISKGIADGAYDTEEIHKLLHECGAKITIPPAVTSKAQHELKNKKPYKGYLKQRDATINRIRKECNFKIGLKQWKIESGYHRRSLIETCIFRFKRIFGFNLQQKTEKGRKNEILTKVNLLNKMSLLGMPQYSI